MEAGTVKTYPCLIYSCCLKSYVRVYSRSEEIRFMSAPWVVILAMILTAGVVAKILLLVF